ncbi:MAG: CCA tRNA nucleotidyltransferase [Alphaproteobacteria bacterium]|nr:CCA tRNA nucleotidyltransferase [Alphaproteobacteria bacterium]
MSKLGQLSPQPWMTAPATRAVMAALGNNARFVGGCVRDSVLGRPVKDVDIATPEPPEQVMALLVRAGIKAVPTGLRHGTVTAVVEGRPFEVTTLRKDVSCDGRHAEVEFTDDWVADAARRDFTINAMSADSSGAIYDPFNGLRDLADRRVRFVGNPRQRITEDVLRLLRFFRFFAYYGKPPPEAAALAACRIMAPRLKDLSGERVQGELLKILMAPDPGSVFLLMQGERVLDAVLPEAADFGRLRVLSWLETRGIQVPGVEADAIRRLAALVKADATGVAALSTRLRLSNRQRERLAGLVVVPPEFRPTPDMDPRAYRRALRQLGAERMRDLTLIAWAERKALSLCANSAETEVWLGLLSLAHDWSPVTLPVKGQDVVRLGVPAGPAVGHFLEAAEQWWESTDYRANRAEVLKCLRLLVGSDRSKV